jgi:hypothetical protein
MLFFDPIEWHTSDVHKHHYFSLQAGISVPYEK